MSRRHAQTEARSARAGREPGTGAPAGRRRGRSELLAWLRPQLVGSRSGQTVTCWSTDDPQPSWAPRPLSGPEALEAVRAGVAALPVLVEARRDQLGEVVRVDVVSR